MTLMFRRNPTTLSSIYNPIVNCIYKYHNNRSSCWNKPMLALQQFQLHAKAIHTKRFLLDSCSRFSDRTIYQIARLKNIQGKSAMGIKVYIG